jgi:transposase
MHDVVLQWNMGRERFLVHEWRARKATWLSEQWLKQGDIASVLDVTQPTVSRWLSADPGDRSAKNHRALHPGRRPRLTAEQIRLLPDFLWHGAEAYGFRGELWTCRRVGEVLAEEFGVSYSRSQVSRLLKKRGWTPQVPLLRAIQRDEPAIERWRIEVWPEVKKRANKERRRLVFIDESGFYLLPQLVKTSAPKGHRPVQSEWQTRDHLSVMGALTPQGDIYTLVRQEALTGFETVAFLRHLQVVHGERLLVVWDNSPIHRRRMVKEFLATGAARAIHLEPLPPYAPDLNPIEWLWGHCKGVEMRNLACLDLEQLHMEFHLALGRIRQKPRLTLAFFAGAGLPM